MRVPMLSLLLIVCLAALGFGAGGCASFDPESLETAEMGKTVVDENLNGGMSADEVDRLVVDVKVDIAKLVDQVGAKVDAAIANTGPNESPEAVAKRVKVVFDKAIESAADAIKSIEEKIRKLVTDPVTMKNLKDFFAAAIKYENSKR